MKKFLIVFGIVLLSVLIILLSYFAYIIIDYHRIEDNLSLTPENSSHTKAATNQTLSLITYNIGFGAYSDDYSFFMDGGKYSRAFSKDAVIDNTNGAMTILQKENPDFVVLQEVDTYGTRSYHVDQTEILKKGFEKYSNVFAENYDSPYFLYPFTKPIGANKSGLLTFSRYNINSALRRSLPIEDSFNKFLDLDNPLCCSTI